MWVLAPESSFLKEQVLLTYDDLFNPWIYIKSVVVGKIMAYIQERGTKMRNKLKLGSDQVVQERRRR